MLTISDFTVDAAATHVQAAPWREVPRVALSALQSAKVDLLRVL